MNVDPMPENSLSIRGIRRFLSPGIVGVHLMGLLAMLTSARAQNGTLQLFDGSSLHGSLNGLDPGSYLQWQYTKNRDPVRFDMASVAWVRFPYAGVQRSHPASHWIEFQNGDGVYGQLVALNDREFAVETWSGTRLQAPREELLSLLKLPENYRVLYEGPAAMEGWIASVKQIRTIIAGQLTTPPSPSRWEYRNGHFLIDGPGILGRQFPLQEALELQFGVRWTGTLSLNIDLFGTDPTVDDYRTSPCRLIIQYNSVAVQTVTRSGHVQQLGRYPITSVTNVVDELRLTARANSRTQTVEVYAGEQLVHQWQNTNAWGRTGDAVVFASNRPGEILALGGLRLSTWDGEFDLPPPVSPTNRLARLDLVNDDYLHGTVRGLDRQALQVESAGLELSIPLQRVQRLQFSAPEQTPSPASRTGILVDFQGGGRLHFNPQSWNESIIRGSSPHFGQIAFQLGSVRQVRFNLGRPVVTFNLHSEPSNVLWELHE